MDELIMEDSEKWENCEITASRFLDYLQKNDFDFLLFGSWARKSFTPELYCQDLDIFCFDKSIEDFIKLCDEFEISITSHGQSSPDLALTKLIINSCLKIDYVFPAYKEGFSLQDFERYLYHSPLDREGFFIYKGEYHFDERRFSSLNDVFDAFEQLKVNPYFHLSYATLSMISGRLRRKGLKPLSIENYPELEAEIQHVLDNEDKRKEYIRETKYFLPYRVQR